MLLETFLEQRGLSLTVFTHALARLMEELGENNHSVTIETVRRYTLPDEHPEHRRPRPAQMRGIYILTDGAVQPNHMYRLPPIDEQTKAKVRKLLDISIRESAARRKLARTKGGKAAARSTAKLRKARAGAR